MSIDFSLRQIASIVSTADDCRSERCISGVATDSREVRPGFLYVARVGSELDGHSYLADAFQRGAAGALVDAAWLDSQRGSDALRTWELVGCADTTEALGRLAREWRKSLRAPVLAITGSNGKTTTRALTQTVLSGTNGIGSASIKSFNNHVGLPLTILNTPASARWLLLEAGMNHPGELTYLGGIAAPDAAAVLNIGPAHYEFFGSLDRIADAKCELLAQIAPSGWAVWRSDDAVLREGVSRMRRQRSAPLHELRFGLGADADLSFSDLEQNASGRQVFLLHDNRSGEHTRVELPYPGRHNIYNALAAVALTKAVFPETPLDACADALAKAPVVEMRLQTSQVGRTLLINDAYNANPASTRAGLETAVELAQGGRVTAVIGDMLELGPDSARFHREIGEHAAAVGVARLVGYGRFARDMVAGAQSSGLQSAVVAAHKNDIVSAVTDGGCPDVVLIKGSRGVALDEVIDELTSALHALSSTLPASR
ncbi:MAG: UDP-N-acetylmuramoyl-tripeptide--D-alanyl-D-alanine ligase [Bdellovibrionales bacterium]|nr:UDP-N-acetylmuramoyl-tripeptide--D-alanyl-D-alanine ligase [Bdellovibrionales bacterium]